jgi:serine/threonine-protein kinase
MIRLQALGALELHGADGREVQSVLAQPKRLAFLAYLAVQEGQAFCTRDQVVALFWPEQDHEGARAALNRALYYLRRALGDGVLLSRGDAIGVAPGAVWCDAAELEAAAAEGRHHAALALYRGDLLQGLHVSSSVEFEHWLDAKRERLRQMAVRSAWSLVEEEKRAGNAEAAVDWARWAVERCPYDEASVRKLISLLDGNGDRAGALREYERFARVLANELELAPAPESRALIAAIRAREGVVRTSDAPASANAESTTPVSGTERATSHDDPRATPAEEASRAATESPASDSVRALSSGRRWTARRGPRRMVGAALALSAAALLLAVLRPAPDPRVVLVSSMENRSGDARFPRAPRATGWSAPWRTFSNRQSRWLLRSPSVSCAVNVASAPPHSWRPGSAPAA